MVSAAGHTFHLQGQEFSAKSPVPCEGESAGMIVLGLNFGHDASVTVLEDGAIRLHRERERSSRVRHVDGLTADFILRTLDLAGAPVVGRRLLRRHDQPDPRLYGTLRRPPDLSAMTTTRRRHSPTELSRAGCSTAWSRRWRASPTGSTPSPSSVSRHRRSTLLRLRSSHTLKTRLRRPAFRSPHPTSRSLPGSGPGTTPTARANERRIRPPS